MTSAIDPGVHAALVSGMRTRAFTPRPADAPRRIGAESEVIPVYAATQAAVPLVALVPILRMLAVSHGWTERPSSYGAPIFTLPGDGELSFEPGGQLEFSASPSASASELVKRIQRVMQIIRQAAEARGITLLSVGVDPVNRIDEVPLQLPGERYVAMDAYFSTVGPNGARMMRQTAAFQVSLDAGADPVAEWRLLNAVAPYLIALFANSPVYERCPTGHESYRAHIWRTLDPARTGRPASAPGEDPAAAYVAWALEAPAFLRRDARGAFRPFGELLASGDATVEDWPVHLTTLFPEVRPRGTFEVRSADAVPPEHCAAPLVLLAGLYYDRQAFCEAQTLLLPDTDDALLIAAGQFGLRDAKIRATAQELIRVAAAGAERLGPDIVSAEDLQSLRSGVPSLRGA